MAATEPGRPGTGLVTSGLAEAGLSCAALARALDEPLAGTAPSALRWACLDDPQPWPRDVGQHPDPAIRAFAARATEAGFRPLLIRRPDPDGGPRRVYLADTDPGRPATTSLVVATTDELADLPWPGPDSALPGDPVPAPLLLVCTADRDPCCGTDGRALVDAMAAAGEPDVWACSHLGGHRFAPTALLLPTGYLYGRLDRPAAVAIRAASAAGEVVTERCRGRSTWSAEGQVAELAVRAATGQRAADALTVGERIDDAVPVTDRTGAQWTVEVEALDVDTARPASCGARPTLMVPLRAVAVRPRPAATPPIR